MAFPPNKKRPGLDVMVAVGKPKDGPPPLRSLEDAGGKTLGETHLADESASGPHAGHQEPDADEQGGPSDQDADNGDASMKAMDYAMEIAGDPEVGPAFSAFLEAMCQKLRGAGGAAGDEPDYGGQGGSGGY